MTAEKAETEAEAAASAETEAGAELAKMFGFDGGELPEQTLFIPFIFSVFPPPHQLSLSFSFFFFPPF